MTLHLTMGGCYDFTMPDVTTRLASSNAATLNILYTSAQVEGQSIQGPSIEGSSIEGLVQL